MCEGVEGAVKIVATLAEEGCTREMLESAASALELICGLEISETDPAKLVEMAAGCGSEKAAKVAEIVRRACLGQT